MSFYGDVKKFAVNAEGNADKFRRAVCLKLFSAVIMDTPVDTGRLRASWNTSIRQPDPSITDPPTGGKIPEGQASAMSLDRIEGNLGTFRDTVFLHNPVGYAGFVEYGTPKMTGRFMVSRNIRRIRSLLRGRK